MAESMRRERGMSAETRRSQLLASLREATSPLSGGKLAKRLGVSRQVIVGDVAMLRAAGHDIVSTARGYVLARPPAREAGGTREGAPTQAERLGRRATRTVRVHHTEAQTSDELFTVLESGGSILDVTVEHRVYGRISAHLGISTRADALRFLAEIEAGESAPMLAMTGGDHLHTIAADSETTLDRIERALDAKGYLAPQQAFGPTEQAEP